MAKTFASRITRCPIAHDPERGAEALSLVPGLSKDVAEVVRGAAGSSFHLGDLMRREGDWLAEALAGAPEDALEAVLAEEPGEGVKAVSWSLRVRYPPVTTAIATNPGPHQDRASRPPGAPLRFLLELRMVMERVVGRS